MITARELFFIAVRWRESLDLQTPKRADIADIDFAFKAFKDDAPESFPISATLQSIDVPVTLTGVVS